ncbi:LapA family protein [Paenibacillus taichungensis]
MDGSAGVVGVGGIIGILLIFAIIGFVLYLVFSFAIKRSGIREEISALRKEIRMLEQKVEDSGKNFNDHI